MSRTIIAGKKDALGTQILKDSVRERLGKVGVLEPNLNEAVENLARNVGSVGERAV